MPPKDKVVTEKFLAGKLDELNETLKNMNTSIQGLKTSQEKVDKRLKKIEAWQKKADPMLTCIEKNSKCVKAVVKENKQMNKKLDKVCNEMSELVTKQEEQKNVVRKTEDKQNDMERHSRSWNIRVIGIPEENDEDCIDKVEQILREKFEIEEAREGGAIENAHRDGPKKPGRARHIIARFYSRPNRNQVLRMARETLQGETYYIKEDETKTDRMERIRVRPLMNRLYAEGKRPSFRKGRIFVSGKPYRDENEMPERKQPREEDVDKEEEDEEEEEDEDEEEEEDKEEDKEEDDDSEESVEA